ncbi:hypothetical protein [Thermosulfurimonas dismutans]|uniref:hypothetical protein n=1 Tax=Thermosulfurimonas dismutans TaxID=999894 RepID=UPI000838FF34|nr:hypothetical protein [Thermosulfurimonas dismutans]
MVMMYDPILNIGILVQVLDLNHKGGFFIFLTGGYFRKDLNDRRAASFALVTLGMESEADDMIEIYREVENREDVLQYGEQWI